MNCPHCAAPGAKKRTKLGISHSCAFLSVVVLLTNELARLSITLNLHWYCFARSCLAAPLYTESARWSWDVSRARFPPLLTKLSATGKYSLPRCSLIVANQTTRPSGKALVCWWNLPQSAWEVGLCVSGYWSGWQSGWFTAQWEAEYGGSSAIFQASRRCRWPCSQPSHNRWAYLLSTGQTRDNGQQCPTSNKYISQ